MIGAAQAKVQRDGTVTSLLELNGLPGYLRERGPSEDPEVTEYVVPVEWEQARPAGKAITAPGLFASHVTVCKVRDDRTMSVLTDAFDRGDA